jgi:regulation of enolase protein 1 (concanavalin A-like superfamily)
MFRDDFNTALRPGWEWEYEYPALWRITEDGFLQISGGYESLWEEKFQTNLLWYPLPDGDFVITVHLKAWPSKNFQQAAIMLYESPENYVTINRGYCDLCTTSGSGIYMHYMINGDRDNYEVKEAAEDVYLRLARSGNTMTGSYALEPERWRDVGRFGFNFRFHRAGLGVSNVHADSPLTAYFDYFELLVPE